MHQSSYCKHWPGSYVAAPCMPVGGVTLAPKSLSSAAAVKCVTFKFFHLSANDLFLSGCSGWCTCTPVSLHCCGMDADSSLTAALAMTRPAVLL